MYFDKTTENICDQLKTHLDYSNAKKNINGVTLLTCIMPMKTLLFATVWSELGKVVYVGEFALTFLTFSSIFTVRFPVPGPTSRTTSVRRRAA